jgi:hypothetical protein
MAFVVKDWHDSPTTDTAVSAAGLENLETRLSDYTDVRTAGFFNVREYGAVGDGVTDDAGAIQDAIDACSAADGGIVLIPGGTFALTVDLVPGTNMTIQGAGMGVTILKQTVTAQRIFNVTNVASRAFVRFADFTCYGMWLGDQSLGGDDDRHFAVNGYARVVYENIESLYCRQMGITSAFCDEVISRNTRVEFCARDAHNFTGCGRVDMDGYYVHGCNDDAVAVHTSTVGGNPATEGHRIRGGHIEDSYGIKMLGACKATVAETSIDRPKGYGLYFSALGTEGQNDIMDITASDVTITNVINSDVFGGGDQNDGIYLAPSDTGFAEPVVPTTPTITEPEDLSYLSNTAIAQNAGGQRIRLNNVTVAQTLPAVAAYSDWGYGEAFTGAGFVDPDLLSGGDFDKLTIALHLAGAILSLAVTNNTWENLRDGVLIDAGTYLGSLTIAGGSIRRFKNYAVGLETASVHRGRVRLRDIEIDGDPLFEHANRVAGGKWNAGAVTPGAVDAVNFESVELEGCTFRNLNVITHTDADTRLFFGRNFYRMQAASAFGVSDGSHADNLGIRSPDGIDAPYAQYIAENSDPTNAGYGQILSADVWRLLGQDSIPSSGYWIKGQFVKNTGITESGAGGSKYTIIGYLRLTTGNAHVPNTDWRELRALTGN